MSDTNLSLVLHGKGDLRLEERPIPEPGRLEVQVKIHAVGICGSDVSYWQKGCVGSNVVLAPMVMGHEPSGIVSKLGEGVTTLKVGDRVALEPGVPCRVCRFCKGGRYNLCPDIKYCATPPDHGTLTRYFVHPHDFCFKLPDHVSLEEGAMLQPLAIGVHACQRAGVELGDKVLICGAGPIGVMCMLTARTRGASKLILTDVDSSRLEAAKRLGADDVVLAGDPQQTACQIEALLGGQADVSLDCSGVSSGVSTAIYSTGLGGRVVLVGMGATEMQLPVFAAASREVDLIGMLRFVHDYPKALSMVSSGQVNLGQLVTHRFTLEQSKEAFQAAFKREGVKIIINCQKE